jgi:hypothetical protein
VADGASSRRIERHSGNRIPAEHGWELQGGLRPSERPVIRFR